MKHNLSWLQELHLVFLGERRPASSRPSKQQAHSYKGERPVFYAWPRQPAKSCQLARCPQKENTKPNPPTHFQTNTHFIYSYSSPQKEKKKGENSLLNPNTNTILIHIHVPYLLTCVAYNGGSHLGDCVERGRHNCIRERDEAQFIQP